MLKKIKNYIKKSDFIYKSIIKIINLVNKLSFYLKNGKYSAKDYWEKRGKNFKNEDYQKGIYEQHYWILDKIKTYQPKTILEIGCGFGRNIKFLNDNLDYDVEFTGIDISNSLILDAKTFLKPYENVKVFTSDILSLDIKKQYDLVLIHGVFMHISNNELKKNREHLHSLDFKNLIEVEEVKLDFQGNVHKENINGFTFSHNYLSLGENVNEYKIKNNLIWLDITK